MFQVGNLKHKGRMGFKLFPGSPTMAECQDKPLANLVNPYPDFQKNDSVLLFHDQSLRSVKNCISTSLMFPKKIYRSGKGCELALPL